MYFLSLMEKAKQPAQCGREMPGCTQFIAEGDRLVFLKDAGINFPICFECAQFLVENNEAVWRKKPTGDKRESPASSARLTREMKNSGDVDRNHQVEKTIPPVSEEWIKKLIAEAVTMEVQTLRQTIDQQDKSIRKLFERISELSMNATRLEARTTKLEDPSAGSKKPEPIKALERAATNNAMLAAPKPNPLCIGVKHYEDMTQAEQAEIDKVFAEDDVIPF